MVKTKEEGAVYVSATGTYWDKPSVDADKLKDSLQNNYLREQIGKLVNKVCTGMYSITVLDADGVPNETVAKRLQRMMEAPGVRMWAAIKQSCRDIVSWGPFLYNDVWDQNGSEVYLAKLRRLPPETFDQLPPGRKIYNQVLEGITLSDAGELELWQRTDKKPALIRNAHMMKDRSAEALGGESTVITLVPVVSMIDFSWQAQMQKVNRVASPIIFIKVKNPKGNDIDYAQKILQRWGKDAAFHLRENMEVVELNLQDNEAALNTIAALEARIKAFFAGASSIQKEGSTLGGNAAAEKEMDDEMIASVRTVLEDEWEALLQQYLERNAFDGWTVELKLNVRKQSPGVLEAQQARTGYDTRSMTVNERREKLGLPPLSPEELEDLAAEYERLDPLSAPFDTERFGDMTTNQVMMKARGVKAIADIDEIDNERLLTDDEKLRILGYRGK